MEQPGIELLEDRPYIAKDSMRSLWIASHQSGGRGSEKLRSSGKRHSGP